MAQRNSARHPWSLRGALSGKPKRQEAGRLRRITENATVNDSDNPRFGSSRSPKLPTDAFARRRESFGARAPDYHAVRPSYPLPALSWLLDKPVKEVLDLGAGTGIVAELAQSLGHHVVAVEPDRLMRQEAARLLPGTVHDGCAEEIPLLNDSLDRVIVGQAWHWFDRPKAESEVARVLRPGGYLCLLWNLRDEATPWVNRLGAIVGGEDRTSVTDVGTASEFGPAFRSAEVATFEHTHRLRIDDFLRLVATWSYVAIRADRDHVLARVRALVTEENVTGGAIALPYRCLAVRIPLRR